LLRIVGDLCSDGLPGHLIAADVTPTSLITSNQAEHEQITDVMTALTATVRWKPCLPSWPYY